MNNEEAVVLRTRNEKKIEASSSSPQRISVYNQVNMLEERKLDGVLLKTNDERKNHATSVKISSSVKLSRYKNI